MYYKLCLEILLDYMTNVIVIAIYVNIVVHLMFHVQNEPRTMYTYLVKQKYHVTLLGCLWLKVINIIVSWIFISKRTTFLTCMLCPR